MKDNVQVLEAVEETVKKDSMNAKQKALIIGGIVVTGGLIVLGVKLVKHIKAKKSVADINTDANDEVDE